MIPSEPLRYRAYRHLQGHVRITDVEVSTSELAREYEHVVLIEPSHVGICSADVRELRGERPGRTDFGHEVVGRVLESTHPRFASGDPVVMNPFVKIHRETAFAEKMYLAGTEEMIVSALLKVPSDEVQFSIAEPLACAIHAAHRSSSSDMEPTLVIGAGFFGYLLYCYLDSKRNPVMLANRSLDRLSDLGRRIAGLRTVDELEGCARGFATVFLMQSRLTSEDVADAGRLVREQGEVVLFGAIDRVAAPELYAIRTRQQRIATVKDGKTHFLRGTLDASLADLNEAVAMLSRPEFVKKVAPILADPLSFEAGATHLAHRAGSPRSFHKYLIDMRA